MKLHEKYGDACRRGPIPAYLLGNIWAQDWSNVYPLVALKNADPGYSLDDILKQRKSAAARNGAHRRTVLLVAGLAALPKTFWERSLFVRPKDRDVVCHASAWDINIETTSASRCA
jgi:peptidyl-dipeptidase A